ncbi:MAG: NAD(P)H-dependent oxidoreductase [Sphingomonadaceae bacterium]|nr:NAD(P)H-dependent oxidoreductase [Sphingomonadaceae bacterium]
MPRLFALSASARSQGSRSRQSTDHAIVSFREAGYEIDQIDIGQSPPPFADDLFLRASFTPREALDDTLRAALAYSDSMIDRIDAADEVLIATPMYNLGMPAALKAWFDQIIRPGRTFTMTRDSASPYKGLLADRPVHIITARGSSAFAKDGAAAALNLLDPHLEALLNFIGLAQFHHYDMAGTDEPEFDADLAISAMAIKPSYMPVALHAA